MERGILRVLVGETEGKEPLGRPGHRLEDNIKMHFEKAECGDGLDQGERHLRIRE